MKKEKLLKVARLAVEGELGEREAAASILKANGTTAEDVLQKAVEPEELVPFTFRNKTEKTILFQLYFKMFQTREVYYKRASPKKIRISIPKSKATRFQEDAKTILSLWRKSFDRFVAAFIHTNDLYAPAAEEASGCSLSPEEIEEIVNYARGMQRATLGRLLES